GTPEAAPPALPNIEELPLAFRSGAELVRLCREQRCSIADIMRVNERRWRSDEDVSAGLERIWETMSACIDRGCTRQGLLPGPFKVRRRAPELLQRLEADRARGSADPLFVMDYVNLYAMAVNEE